MVILYANFRNNILPNRVAHIRISWSHFVTKVNSGFLSNFCSLFMAAWAQNLYYMICT